MPLTELSRNQIIQKRREAAEPAASVILESEKKPDKKKEKNIFVPEDETEMAQDEHS